MKLKGLENKLPSPNKPIAS